MDAAPESQGENMLTLLLTASLILPVQAEEAGAEIGDESDEFSFINEGEKNRELREAERVPSSAHFLQDDEDEAFEPSWDTGKAPTLSPSFDGIEEDADLLDEQPSFNPSIDFGDVYDADENYEIGGVVGGVVGGVLETEDYDDDLAGEEMVTMGLAPLGDHFPLTIVKREADSAIIELPILVANRIQDHAGKDFWIIADILVDGQRVGESRHLVTGNSIAATGSTFVWIKATAPLDAPDGTIGVKISYAPVRGSETPLFTRSVSYR